MYKQTTSVKVNEFLEEVSKRNTKIDSKVDELDLQIKSLNQEISKVQEAIVEYDLNKDINSKNTATKEKNKFNTKLNDLISERAAYVEAKKPGNMALKVKAEKVNAIAEKEMDQIYVLIAKKRENISNLQIQKDQVEENIKDEELELQNLEWNINNIVNNEIPKIIKYVTGEEEKQDKYEDRTPKVPTAYVDYPAGDEPNPYTRRF